ncbi:hypothetical protein TWF694_008695 [Orbilia ellipsospora]|uniref:C3H1-type domain-containing protein n=1 Tax=Orbilia ellipsospora TaxID=2528407 RepID=A0AAV9XCT2_9PEZI
MKGSYQTSYKRERWGEEPPSSRFPQATGQFKHSEGRDDSLRSDGRKGPTKPLQKQTKSQIACRNFVGGFCKKDNCPYKHPIEYSPLYVKLEARRAETKKTPLGGMLRKVELNRKSQEEHLELQRFNFPDFPGSGIGNDLQINRDPKIFEKHFKSNCKGPRRLNGPPPMGDLKEARKVLTEKRRKHKHFDVQAYKEFMKYPQIYTWCHLCRGRTPNCGACALREMMGRPAPIPSAEELIIENADFFRDLLGMPAKKQKPEPVKARNSSKAPQEAPKKYREPLPRPEWDTEVLPDTTKYDSWSNYEPVDPSTWDIFITPRPPVKPKRSEMSIIAPVRPTDKSKKPPVPVKPASPTVVSLEPSGPSSQGSFILGQRPGPPKLDRPAARRSGPQCFRCWEDGHNYRDCWIKKISVRTQEENRVAKGVPLSPLWMDILDRNGLKPLDSKVPSAVQQPRHISKPSMKADSSISPQDSVDTVGADAKNPVSPHADEDLLVFSQDELVSPVETSSRKIEVAETQYESSKNETHDPLVKGKKSEDPGVDTLFRPENARYHPISDVSSNVTRKLSTPRSAISRLPNELLVEIFKFLLDEEIKRATQISEDQKIYNEETAVRRKNLHFDALRKVNNLWRSLCQAEVYRTVPITSTQSLAKFTRSIANSPELAALVLELKIEIHSPLSDGWTSTSDISTSEDDKIFAFGLARCLSVILSSCPKLINLVARFGGAFQALILLNKTCNNLQRLYLEDNLPRKLDIKGLWKATRHFPNLKLLQLEASPQPHIESKNTILIASDLDHIPSNLTSLGLKSFPFVSDTFLSSILPCLPSLKKLHVEQCPGITTQGLARALQRVKPSTIQSLTFKTHQSLIGESKTENDTADGLHLCEVLPAKFSQSLLYLSLSGNCVCESLINTNNWENLEYMDVQSINFKGCTPLTTEDSFRRAVMDANMPKLAQDPFIHFGFPQSNVMDV